MVIFFAAMAAGEGSIDVQYEWAERNSMAALQANLQLAMVLGVVQIALYPLGCFCQWFTTFAK